MAELSTLARPYSKAAFEFAVANGDLEEWSTGLKIAAAVTQQTPLIKILTSPNTTTQQKSAAVLDVCGESLSVACQNFITVLSESRRLQLLPRVSQQFHVMKDNHEKVIDVNVTSARKLDTEQQQQLIDVLSKKLERHVNIQVALDKSLLGGVVIRAGDIVIDGSVRGRLAKLAESLNT
jgi:F-type H+-transporting ATPase subunit delta